MYKTDFNTGWTCNGAPVTLPHDAQIAERRSAGASDGGHGYFPGGRYVYRKAFTAPREWEGRHVLLEFEGVYRNCTVELNGKAVGGHRYGYTTFAVELAGLRYGGENVLTVTADNTELPNSRWYTGSGIYRPVWLYVGEPAHIAYRGVRVTTLSYDTPAVRVRTEHSGGGEVGVEVVNGGNKPKLSSTARPVSSANSTRSSSGVW